MKILYATQATGNGHLSRAREVIPVLQKFGNVTVAVSGSQAEVDLPYPIEHQFHGLSFTFGKRGGIDYRDTVRQMQLGRLARDIRNFDCSRYDLIMNDFEPVTAWAAFTQRHPVLALSHQAAFRSRQTPRPRRRDFVAEAIMGAYAPSSHYAGFHFEPYDDFIHTPVIRSQVRELTPRDGGYHLVYLPAYDDQLLANLLNRIPNHRWIVFSKTVSAPYQTGNVTVRRVNNDEYLPLLESCAGLLTGGGFESPAEALFLGKKLMVVPMAGQYEQRCNAEALRRLGVPVLSKVDQSTLMKIGVWADHGTPIHIPFPDETFKVIDSAIERVLSAEGADAEFIPHSETPELFAR